MLLMNELGSVKELVATKLGRCPKCMRAARNGMIISWGVAALLYWLQAGSIFLIPALMVAVTFTGLLAAHAVTFTWRQYRPLLALRRARAALQPESDTNQNRRQFMKTVFNVGAGVGLVSLVDVGQFMRASATTALCPPQCECYFWSDCKNTDRGERCDYEANCTKRAKPDEKINDVLICGTPVGQAHCDGMCVREKRSGASWSTTDPELVAQAADLYFQAYIATGMTVGGPPEPVLLAQALAVPIHEDWHLELQNAVHTAMDLALGWDWMPAPPGQADCLFGEVPIFEEAADLVEAFHQGIVTGLLENNPDAAAAPIQAFWDSGSTYHPHHTGRCYPHGHPDIPDTPTCQTQEANALLTFLLAGREATQNSTVFLPLVMQAQATTSGVKHILTGKETAVQE